MNGWCFVVFLADGFFKNVIVVCKIYKLFVKFWGGDGLLCIVYWVLV